VEASPTPNSNNTGKPEDTESKSTETETESQLRAELSKAVSEVAAQRAKVTELEDKYLRALAEMENLRTRMTKQINDAKLYATQGFCKDLADIEDILQLAISSVPKDQVETNKHLKELYQGLVMTEARLLQVFKNHGLTQINPLNEKFNPNDHEAVMQMEQPGKESGTVVFVSKVGYKLHDRVIRPAVVGVAK
jgi:molecular chaperone GrpE